MEQIITQEDFFMSNGDVFEEIPEIKFECVTLSRNNSMINGENFNVQLQNFSNNLVCQYFPVVAASTLKCIDDELSISLDMKIKTLKKLQQKYSRRTRNINIVHDIIIDDFEMAIEDNVQLILRPYTNLMKTTPEKNLLQLILKQFELIPSNTAAMGKEYTNIYKLLRETCDNKFTEILFASTANNKDNNDEDEDDNGTCSADDSDNFEKYMQYRLVQVWQIFNQYFKQFDYVDYVQNFYIIKTITNIKFILTILRILVEIGSIECKYTNKTTTTTTTTV